MLSEIYEKLLARKLCKFVNTEAILPSGQFGFRKGFGTVDALLTIFHDLHAALDKTTEARVHPLDFSSAFDLVNHEGLLYKLKS